MIFFHEQMTRTEQVLQNRGYHSAHGEHTHDATSILVADPKHIFNPEFESSAMHLHVSGSTLWPWAQKHLGVNFTMHMFIIQTWHWQEPFFKEQVSYKSQVREDILIQKKKLAFLECSTIHFSKNVLHSVTVLIHFLNSLLSASVKDSGGYWVTTGFPM